MPGHDRVTADAGAQDDGLRASLSTLSGLAADRLSLVELLTRTAVLAVDAIPGADGAGLALIEEGRRDTIVSTAEFVSKIDSIQYGLGQGPCITAAAEVRTVVSGSLGSDTRWRQFGGGIRGLDVHSVVSLPLQTPDGVVGALNVYAHAEDAFDERAVALGEIYAAPAAIAVQNAHILEQTRRLVVRLETAVDARVVIERAVGIIMSRSGVDEHEALDRLRRLSRHQEVELAVLAQNLIDEAVARARLQRRPQ